MYQFLLENYFLSCLSICSFGNLAIYLFSTFKHIHTSSLYSSCNLHPSAKNACLRQEGYGSTSISFASSPSSFFGKFCGTFLKSTKDESFKKIRHKTYTSNYDRYIHLGVNYCLLAIASATFSSTIFVACKLLP